MNLWQQLRKKDKYINISTIIHWVFRILHHKCGECRPNFVYLTEFSRNEVKIKNALKLTKNEYTNLLFLFGRVQYNTVIICYRTTYCNCRNKKRINYFLTKWNLRSNQKTITNKSLLPARCLRGIPASTSAAHAAFIAHGRS